MKPLMITTASTGGFWTKADTPYLPVTCDEMIADSISSFHEGASMFHLHARDENGAPTFCPVCFKKLLDGLKNECPDAILQMSVGGMEGKTHEFLEPLLALHPDVASFNLKGSDEEIDYMFEMFAKYQVKPIFELFSMEMLQQVKSYIVQKRIAFPPLIEFVFDNISGNDFNDYARALLDFYDQVPEGAVWSVARGGKYALRLIALAASLGGDFRTGIEDSLEIEDGVLAKSSSELVSNAVSIVKGLGRSIADPVQSRQILQI